MKRLTLASRLLPAALLWALAACATGPVVAQQVGGYPNAVTPLQGTERMVADQTIAGVTTTVDITPAMLEGYLFPSGALSVSLGGTGVATLTGIPVGNGVAPFSAATAANVISLWAGSCSSSTYLNGAGTCVTPPGGGTVTTSGTPPFGSIAAFSSTTVIQQASVGNVIDLWSGVCNSTTYLRADGTCQPAGGSGGLGTVTSVAINASALPGLIVSGSPITTAGTITLSGVLGLAGGGTNATNAATALTNLLPAQSGQSGKCLGSNGTAASWSSCGSGTVTSIALTVPSFFAVTGSPITTSGTIAIASATLTGNLIIASPNGSSGALAARALMLGDLPLIPLPTQVTGVLPVANGGIGVATLTGIAKGNGTGAFTAATSANIISLWTGICSSTTFLRGDGACTAPAGGGSGTVTSVGLAAPAWLTVTGSPVTTSGTLTLAGTSESANLFLASPNGSSGAVSPRAIVLADLPTITVATGGTGATTLTGPLKGNGTSAITAAASADIIGLWTGSCSSSTYLNGAGTCTTPSGAGTVTSVAFADASTTPIYTISGTPVTGTGTLTQTLATQNANLVFAGPSSGGPVQPTFRTLAAADLSTAIASSTWNGTVVAGQYGGTGVANTGKTITLGGNLTTSGANAVTFTTTGATSLTLPTSGTLVANNVATLSSLTSIGTIGTGIWQGSVIAATYGGTGEAGTITGVLKGNGTSAQSAAASSDVIALWTGTCSSSTFLRGDGACAAASGGGGTPANPTGTVGLTAVNGSATTYMRSDAAPPLSQTIAPTMTGNWNFTPSGSASVAVTITPGGNQGLVVNAPTSALVAETVNGIAGANTLNVVSAVSGASQGLYIQAGNTSANYAALVKNAAGTTTLAELFGDGGLTLGSPTGGDKGAGTFNASGAVYTNGYPIGVGLPLCNGGAQITGNYTLALADRGKQCQVEISSAATVTIPANSSIAFPEDGTAMILVQNEPDSTANLSLAITSDTLYFLPFTNVFGTRTLPPGASCVIAKQGQSSTVWTATCQGAS